MTGLSIRRWRAVIVFGALGASAALTVLVGCETEKAGIDATIAAYRARALAEYEQELERSEGQAPSGAPAPHDTDRLVQLVGSQSEETKRAGLMVEPDVDQAPAPADVLAQVPDPREAEQVLSERLAVIEREALDKRVVNQYRSVVEKAHEYLSEFQRPQQIELSLADCIQRALRNNYTIRIEQFTPAISRTRLVEAEAAFDASFFLDTSYNNVDRQISSELFGTQSDTRSYRGGLRQLLPTGMRAEAALGQTRTFTNLSFVTLNPAYDTSFTTSFTQPLLRGFGLDYNRAGIEIARVGLEVDYETFRRQVRDTLLAVEQAYWQLVSARRAVMILAELAGQNWVTYNSIVLRGMHDATQVQLANARSRWQSRVVQYLEAIKLVRDAEDRLKNLLNDPDFPLSDDVEIIPTETPLVAPMLLDQFAEVRTGLDRRSEVRSAKLAIEQARIQTLRAKNETLPQLDLSFSYEVQGIGSNADRGFDNVTTNRYRSYSVTVNFSYPLGDRGPRAAYHRAGLEERRAIAGLHRVLDGVVTDVNNAVRQLMFRYKQIPPQLDSVVAAHGNLRAMQDRAEVVDPLYLETELNTIERLGSERQTLLGVVVDYNVAIAQLESAKGTLLDYYNVTISDEPE